MKIGIITYHRAHNYGAVLQCYALSTMLIKLGHEVEVIDYYPSYFQSQYALFSLTTFKSLSLKAKIVYLSKFILCMHLKRRRVKVFNEFINNLPLSQRRYDSTIDEITGYDALIFGSDQIWNPLLTGGEDKVFSGKIIKNKSLFISYAASTNPLICDEAHKPYFTGILSRFNAVSVRESSLMNYLNSIVPASTKVVLDPVLLLDKLQWEKIALLPKENDYLLIYTVPQHKSVRRLADMIALAKGLKVIEIRPYVTPKHQKGVLQTTSPNEFLGYFKCASFVVTTSFHGTAFSIKFNKQFITLRLGTGVDERAMSLLNSVGLNERMMSSDKLSVPANEIDYSLIVPKLNMLIDESIDFIKLSLSNES